MKWLAICCAIALVVLGGPAAHAEPLDVEPSRGDILHVRDLSREEAIEVGFDSLGYHYQSFDIYGLDLWRWGGEFVVYKDGSEPSPERELHEITRGTVVLYRWIYVSLTDSELEVLGGPGVPWSYRCPPGLLLGLALIELGLVAPWRRSPRIVLPIGGGLLVLALVLWWRGGGQGSAIPLLLGLYHAGVGWLAIRRDHQDADVAGAGDEPAGAAAEPAEPAVEPTAKPRPLGPRRPEPRRPPSSAEAGPFRAPPQPMPLVVEYPPTAPSSTGIAAKTEGQATEEEPKHLR